MYQKYPTIATMIYQHYIYTTDRNVQAGWLVYVPKGITVSIMGGDEYPCTEASDFSKVTNHFMLIKRPCFTLQINIVMHATENFLPTFFHSDWLVKLII